jgi:hypothetical protein
MFVLLPRTVAFKAPGMLFFRRVRGVVKAEVTGWGRVRLTTRRGKVVVFPEMEAVVVYGRLVTVEKQ